ncbi:MAG: PrgI family protein [bacterium]
MYQVVVPQFLDVEDKVFGPITIRQFIEMLMGALLIFIFNKIFDFSLFVLSAFVVGIITGVLAFVKINGQPFHEFLLNFLGTIKNPKLKVWKKMFTKEEIKNALRPADFKAAMPNYVMRQPVTSSKLSELSLIVDTGGVYHGES